MDLVDPLGSSTGRFMKIRDRDKMEKMEKGLKDLKALGEKEKDESAV